ncbi:uncharacterized protein LOC110425344 isoform X2 [Herrania umbratica]|uniref:Uncharacterized protein LOC110425344 isoform X2 n=1 Tax=Herrania umbratica TaxID=108875 RepID=A0A6J1B9Q7_9ROSI|nr:uncharacterized protein LOC110425344 isoform X2 [Herrania umbratica]
MDQNPGGQIGILQMLGLSQQNGGLGFPGCLQTGGIMDQNGMMQMLGLLQQYGGLGLSGGLQTGGLSQYQVNLPGNPGTPVAIPGTNNAVEQSGNETNNLSEAAIRSKRHRVKKKDEVTNMQKQITEITELNGVMSAEIKQLNEKGDHQVNEMRQLQGCIAQLEKTNTDLKNQVEELTPLVMDVQKLQKENLELKAQNHLLMKKSGADINRALMNKYGKSKSKIKRLKTANLALTMQIINYNDDEDREQGGPSKSNQSKVLLLSNQN